MPSECASSSFPPSHSHAFAHALPSLGLLAPLFSIKNPVSRTRLGLNLDLGQIVPWFSHLKIGLRVPTS